MSSIRLRRFEPAVVTAYRYLKAWRIRIEAYDATGEFPHDKIFIWQRLPPNPSTLESVDVGICVAGPVDLEELPEDEPDMEVGPYFLRNWIEFDVRSLALADSIWTVAWRETCALRVARDMFVELSEVMEVLCGEEPTSSQSGSESESSSV